MLELALSDSEHCVALKPGWFKGHLRKSAALHLLSRCDVAKAMNDMLTLTPGPTTVWTPKP